MKGKSSILGGALLLTAGNLVLRMISIGLNVFLTRRIGASGLGLMQLIATVGGFALLAGTCGIRVSAMCLAAEEFGRRRPGGVRLAMRTCLKWGLAISALAGGALLLAAQPVAEKLLKDGRAALSLRLTGIFLPVTCLSGIMTGYLTACSKIRQLVCIKLAEELLSAGLTVLLLQLWAGERVTHACAAIVLGSSLAAIADLSLLLLVYLRDMRRVPPQKEEAQMKKRLLHLALPLALNDDLRAGLTTAEQLLIPLGLARFGGSSAQAMADYGTIHAMVFPILMFPAAILYAVSDLLVPELARSRAMGRTLRICDLTDKCLRLTLLFACGVAGFLFLAAEPLAGGIYGSRTAGAYLRRFCPMLVMLYVDAITDGMLKGLAQQVSCVRYNTLTSALDVALLWVLLPRLGLRGYLVTFALTHGVNLFLSLRRLITVTGYRPRAADALLPPLCCALGIIIARHLPAAGITQGIWFLLFLGGAFLLTQRLSARDCRWLRSVAKRSCQTGRDGLSLRGNGGYGRRKPLRDERQRERGRAGTGKRLLTGARHVEKAAGNIRMSAQQMHQVIHGAVADIGSGGVADAGGNACLTHGGDHLIQRQGGKETVRLAGKNGLAGAKPAGVIRDASRHPVDGNLFRCQGGAPQGLPDA